MHLHCSAKEKIKITFNQNIRHQVKWNTTYVNVYKYYDMRKEEKTKTEHLNINKIKGIRTYKCEMHIEVVSKQQLCSTEKVKIKRKKNERNGTLHSHRKFKVVKHVRFVHEKQSPDLCSFHASKNTMKIHILFSFVR